MEAKNAPIAHAVSFSWTRVIVITLVFDSSSYMTGFMSHVLCNYSCTVLCDYVFSVIA